MHVGQQCTAVLKRSLFKFNRNKHNRSVKGNAEITRAPDRDQRRARPPAQEPQPSHHLSGTPAGHFCIPFQLASWLSSRAQPPTFKLETNHSYVKRTSELFPSWAIPEYKTCSEKLHRSLEKRSDLVTAARAAPWLGQPWVDAKQWSHAIISLLIQWWQNSLGFYFQTVLFCSNRYAENLNLGVSIAPVGQRRHRLPKHAQWHECKIVLLLIICRHR